MSDFYLLLRLVIYFHSVPFSESENERKFSADFLAFLLFYFLKANQQWQRQARNLHFRKRKIELSCLGSFLSQSFARLLAALSTWRFFLFSISWEFIFDLYFCAVGYFPILVFYDSWSVFFVLWNAGLMWWKKGGGIDFKGFTLIYANNLWKSINQTFNDLEAFSIDFWNGNAMWFEKVIWFRDSEKTFFDR